MTLIIGACGSMGRRYKAILSYLGQPYECHDPKLRGFGVYPSKSHDRFIVATPTDTHLEWVLRLDSYGKPILCEKPLSTNLLEVAEILRCKSPISMMLQYGVLVSPKDFGPTHYNYYHTGNDGLAWDCFQIIALAKGKLSLGNTSPVWECMINGAKIDRSTMDQAYVDAVRNWLNGFLLDRSDLLDWHKKVKEFENTWTINT